MDSGFDYFYGTTDHKDGHFRYPEFVYRNTEKIKFPGNKLHTGTDYDANLYTGEALGYIGNQKAETPFFLLLSYPIPHASVIAPEEERIAARPQVEGRSRPQRFQALHQHPRSKGELHRHAENSR